MSHACIVTVEFCVHEIKDGHIFPSAKKIKKAIQICYNNSEEECMDKIDKIINQYNLSVYEEKP